MKDINKNKVGRPIEKVDRVKIGLSIDGKTNDILSKLAKLTGKTKSKVFEEAIRILENRESIIQSRIETIDRLGDEALLDFEEYIKNRKAIKIDMEVQNVG